MDFSDLDTSLKVTLQNVTLYSNWLYNNRDAIRLAENKSSFITSRIGFVESNRGAIISFLKKTGLVTATLEVSPLAMLIAKEELLYRELCLIHLSKESLFLKGEPKVNLITLLSKYVQEKTENEYNLNEIRNIDLSFQEVEGNKNSNSRTDYIVTLLEGTELFRHKGKVEDGVVALTSKARPILDYFAERPIANCEDDLNSVNRFNYFSSLEKGVFGILSNDMPISWIELFPHLTLDNIKKIKNNFNTSPMNKKFQCIFYGAPGTGKSHEINELTRGKSVIRTTFHPDSDYSTFVGCYKPKMKRSTITKDGVTTTEEKIVYSFEPQAFTNAYVQAWKKTDDVYLIIEEINRGNCAQIFGDLFQLLDRKNGESEYPVETDSALADYLQTALANSERNDIPAEVKNGTKLKLPSNLFIWATMNTSDQSLFPIDSAFKRRWEWRYMKIKNERKEWKIDVKIKDANGEEKLVDWWDFIRKVNDIIASMTSSADKQLGYFFCKADKKTPEKAGEPNSENNLISVDTLVSKVLFYLWNDVFKDYGFEDASLFQYTKMEDGKETKKDLTFPDFYKEDCNDVNPTMVTDFVQKVMNWKKKEEAQN